MVQQCDAETLQALLAQLESGEDAGVRTLNVLTTRFPSDARLLFLRGSTLAGRGDLNGARQDMTAALALEPDYAILRYQLGFLEYTSGKVPEAETIWQAFDALEAGHTFRVLRDGWLALARDDVPLAVRLLSEGRDRMSEFPPIARDVSLALSRLNEIQNKASQEDDGAAGGEDDTHLLISGYTTKRRH